MRKDYELAEVFALTLYHDLSQAELATVIETNLTNEASICATHDFLDANMNMHLAFRIIMGRRTTMSDKDNSLWSDAWGIAKLNHFSTQLIRAAGADKPPSPKWLESQLELAKIDLFDTETGEKLPVERMRQMMGLIDHMDFDGELESEEAR